MKWVGDSRPRHEELTNKPDHNMTNNRFAKAEVWWIQFFLRTKNLGQADRQTDRQAKVLLDLLRKSKLTFSTQYINFWLINKTLIWDTEGLNDSFEESCWVYRWLKEHWEGPAAKYVRVLKGPLGYCGLELYGASQWASRVLRGHEECYGSWGVNIVVIGPETS